MNRRMRRAKIAARKKITAQTVVALKVRGSDQLLRFAQVRELVPLSRTTLWRKIRDGTFPAPIKLSDHARGWRLSTIRRWIADREAA